MNYKNMTFEELADLYNKGVTNADLLREIARRYREGDGVEQDLEQAEMLEEDAETLSDNNSAGEKPADAEQQKQDSASNSIVQTWIKEMSELNGKPMFAKIDAANAGNPFAMVQIAVQYAETGKKNEIAEAIETLKKAQHIFEAHIDDSPEIKKALADTLLKEGRITASNIEMFDDRKKAEQFIFEVFSQAHEQDEAAAAEDLSYCYKNGIGVDKDINEALRIEETVANSYHAPEKLKFACSLIDAGREVQAVYYLQKALYESGSLSETETHEARWLLSALKRTDEKGLQIDPQAEANAIYSLLNAGDPEAAWFAARYIAPQDADQLADIAEKGSHSSNPEHAAYCKNVINQINERKRQAEEQKAAAERAEAARIAAAQKAEEERKKAEAQEAEKQKASEKKKNAIKKLAVAFAVAIAAIIAVASIVNRPKKFDVYDYVTVSFDGYEGYAKPKLTFDSESASAELGKNLTDSTINFTFNKKNGLSNGDEVTVKAVGNSYLRNNKLKIKTKEKSFKVSGLKEAKKVDVFDGLEVNFKGFDGQAYADITTSSDDAFIQELKFTSDPKDNLSVGDKVTVKADASDDLINEYGEIPAEASKEYTVDSLEGYAKSFSDISDDSLNQLISEGQTLINSNLRNNIEKTEVDLDWWPTQVYSNFDFTINPYTSYLITSKTDSKTLQSVDDSSDEDDPKYNNILIIIYRCDASAQDDGDPVSKTKFMALVYSDVTVNNGTITNKTLANGDSYVSYDYDTDTSIYDAYVIKYEPYCNIEKR